jgi:hypothetical protein
MWIFIVQHDCVVALRNLEMTFLKKAWILGTRIGDDLEDLEGQEVVVNLLANIPHAMR